MLPQVAFVAALLLSSTALAVPRQVEVTSPAHGVQTQSWPVPVAPAVPRVTLEDTKHQLTSQPTKINHSHQNELPPRSRDLSQPRVSARAVVKRDIEGHQMGRISCNNDFYGVTLGTVFKNKERENILFGDLDRRSGQPKTAPMSCDRVNCLRSLAVTWCNLTTREKVLESFGLLANTARYIADRCDSTGQVEFQDGWTVMFWEHFGMCD